MHGVEKGGRNHHQASEFKQQSKKKNPFNLQPMSYTVVTQSPRLMIVFHMLTRPLVDNSMHYLYACRLETSLLY